MIVFEPDKIVLGFWFVGYHRSYLCIGAYMENGNMKFLVDSESDQLKPGCSQEEYLKHLSALNGVDCGDLKIPTDPIAAKVYHGNMAASLHEALYPLAVVFMRHGYTAKSGGIAYKLGPITSDEANGLLRELPWDRLMGTDIGARC